MRILWSLLLLGISIQVSIATTKSRLTTEPLNRDVIEENFRLPFTVEPLEYDIKITPNLSTFKFDANTKIKFLVNESGINEVKMHSKLLHDIVATVTQEGIGGPGFDVSIEYETDYDFIKFRFIPDLNINQIYVLDVTYNGEIQEGMNGLYRSSYEQDGVTKTLATTLSFPTNARSILPCFDEPKFKAVFKLTIVCPQDFSCISNMKPITPSTGNEVAFHPTPPMSTYLLAFIISEFVPIQSTPEDDEKPFGIWGRPGAQNMGEYAFETGRKLVDAMDKYIGIEYYDFDDNMKMDHAAIPDFAAGAMENWGMVTYREDNAMIHPTESTTKYKKRVASVFAHEIAHMWFGDLVTYDWFSYVWLSEAFGRYYEYFLTEKVEAFGMEDLFVVEQIHSALAADSSVSSPPMTNKNIFTPAQIWDHFGTISYNKGASVLRMIQNWIGEDDYVDGLTKYLNDNKFKTGTPDKLIAALEDTADVSSFDTTIKEVMESWTAQAGYPLLRVKLSDDVIELEQVRFTRNMTASNQRYLIPITYTTESLNNFVNTTPIVIMEGEKHSIPYTDGWIIFNIQQTGFYRVAYDEELWTLLMDVLNGENREDIHRYNRAQIIDDAFNLAREGYMEYTLMLDIIQFLEHETDYAPWGAAFNGFSFMRQHFGNITVLTKDLDDHISNLMTNAIDHLGLELQNNDTNLMRIFRADLLRLACDVQHPDCISSSIRLFRNWEVNLTRVEADHREHVYCNGLRYGEDSDYDFLWGHFLTDNVAAERIIILVALGCTRRQNKINELLMNTISENSDIREQDRMTAFNSALTRNRENAHTVSTFIQENTLRIKEVYGSGGFLSLVSSLAMRLSEEPLNELQAWSQGNSNLTPAEITSIGRSIESARSMIDWAESKTEEISTWLDAKYNSAGLISASMTMIFAMVFVVLANH